MMLLSVAFYPAYNSKPKDLPLAIVNLDEGTSIQSKSINIGKNLEDHLLKINQRPFNGKLYPVRIKLDQDYSTKNITESLS